MNEEEHSIKATVTESNGEISCSIEETNRIRALLGLKPLKVDSKSKEQISVENFHKQKEDEAKCEYLLISHIPVVYFTVFCRAREAQEIKDRIESARTQRMLKSKLDETASAELASRNETQVLSASEWVQRSRQKEVSEKERKRREAEEAARRLDEEDELLTGGQAAGYSHRDLKGLLVKHGADDFDIGETVILTLADSSILKKDEHGKVIGVNEDVDALENVNISEAERRKLLEQRKKRATQPVYAGYDDDEFAEGVAPKTKRGILPQYDKEKVSGPKLVLAENGVVALGAASESGVSSSSIENKRIQESLSSEAKILADYLTPAEFAKFHKPKKEKKMRKIRKKDKEESLNDLMDITAETKELERLDGNSDRGSRSRSGAGAGPVAQVALADSMRRQAYDQAVKMAEAESAKVYGAGKAVPARARVDEEGGDDDDIQMALALERAKQISKKIHAADTADNGGAMDVDDGAPGVRLLSKDAIASMAIQNAGGSEEAIRKIKVERSADPGQFEIDAEGRYSDGTLIFSDTTEFTSRLQARMNERVREKADAAVKELLSKKRTRDDQYEAEGDEMAVDGAMSDEGSGESGESEPDDDLEPGDDPLGLHRQPVATRGLAATLALLKGSGDLHVKDELAGRTKDERSEDPSSGDLGVKLEYRDEFGRKLTKKEAFRQLSYRFHGFGPSRAKQEKRLQVRWFHVASNVLTSPLLLPSYSGYGAAQQGRVNERCRRGGHNEISDKGTRSYWKSAYYCAGNSYKQEKLIRIV
jgi:U4/U6.U5 tri-snRNP-associated protein 1